MLGRLVHLINNVPLWFFVRRARTLLDVGCGVNSPVNYFVTRWQDLDGLDISATAFQRRQHNKYRRIFCQDIRDFKSEELYDVITALDFIEHVPKQDGRDILTRMEQQARRVIIVTPNGYIPQLPDPNNPWQEHKSGWQAEDFLQRGYRVYGMFGPKALRVGTAVLRFHPKFFWGLIVWLLTPMFFWWPRRSFSLLAIYDNPRPI